MSIKKITIQNCFPSGPKHSVKNTFGEQYSLNEHTRQQWRIS
uniref:Uncharacterized protein n=1 Tax=Anguilla anguilla TaxID=7936 RepID=A0A0E9UVJ3_ANGAN